MKLVEDETAAAFLDRNQSWLEQLNEAGEMILGVCRSLIDQPDRFENPLFLSVEEKPGLVAGAVLQTPPQRILVSRLSAEGTEAVVSHLLRENRAVPGVFGPAQSARRIAEEWSFRTGHEVHKNMDQRMYSCRRVTERTDPPCDGSIREATKEDVSRLAAWRRQFIEETGLDDPVDKCERPVIRGIEKHRIFVWVAGGDVVSMVAIDRPTRRGISITFVYTPPEFRGRGYAGSATARVTAMQLSLGKEFCTLFADLANPISNHLYQKIGFRKVEDLQLWSFATR